MAAAGILELRKKAPLRLYVSYIERVLPRTISQGRDTRKAEEMGVQYISTMEPKEPAIQPLERMINPLEHGYGVEHAWINNQIMQPSSSLLDRLNG